MFPLVKTSDTVATLCILLNGLVFHCCQIPGFRDFLKAFPAATFSLRCVEVFSVFVSPLILIVAPDTEHHYRVNV
jgi:hypothetical protein